MGEELQEVICDFPFTRVIVNSKGDVHFCCPDWIDFYSIGNLNENKFSDIWYGDKAKEFRQQFFDRNYKYCNLNLCIKGCSARIQQNELLEKPKIVIFSYDSRCNQRCIFCRDKKILESDIPFFAQEENLDKILLDLLENADYVTPSTSGECFFSKETKFLIKRISELFPNIKFFILTNGLLSTPELLEELNITDKICSMTVSLHSTNEKTYNKIVEGGNYKKVRKNLDYFSQLKKENKIENFQINFVVNAINYREMPDFVKLAQKLGAQAQFLEFLDTNISRELYEKLNIFSETHPKHKDFCKILRNPIFQSEHCIMNDFMSSFSKKDDKPKRKWFLFECFYK